VYLIVGLGNPGSKYKNTRHNIGFMVVSRLAKALGVRFNGKRFESRNALARYRNRELILFRPQTFMNQSGRAVKSCVDYFGLKLDDVLVIHDDLDLPLERVKVVQKGGAGGHRGILSLTQSLGTDRFSRVKVGIGRPRYDEGVEDYVLSPFYKHERVLLEEALQLALQAVRIFITDGVVSAMNEVNRYERKGISPILQDS
jgi:PTH1 family peptidyl-tRNA hydrolase